MNYGKAVEEVWVWREAVAKKALAVPRAKRVAYFNDTARAACKKLGLKGRTPTPRLKAHA
jgi:hypothetical protein